MFALRVAFGQAIFVDPTGCLEMVQTAVNLQPSEPILEAMALWRGLVKTMGGPAGASRLTDAVEPWREPSPAPERASEVPCGAKSRESPGLLGNNGARDMRQTPLLPRRHDVDDARLPRPPF